MSSYKYDGIVYCNTEALALYFGIDVAQAGYIFLPHMFDEVEDDITAQDVIRHIDLLLRNCPKYDVIAADNEEDK